MSLPRQRAPLLSPADLAPLLGQGGVTILDIRFAGEGGGAAAFAGGHVPGAIHTDYGRDGWRVHHGTAAGLLPEPDALAALFGRLGLLPDAHVVIVSAGGSPGDVAAASRVFWTLKVAGHRALSILDGGFAAWAGEGRPVEQGAGTAPVPSRFPVRIDPGPRAVLEQVAAAVAGDGSVLLDSRSERAFTGAEKSGQVARAGRLPGAVLLDGATLVDPATGFFKRGEALARSLAVLPAGPVIAYCNTGQAAATDWFVLSELLGRADVRLYDGSLSEWTGDPARPVETGPAPSGPDRTEP